MKSTTLLAAAAFALGSLFVTESALAGSVTAATGPIKVNGQTKTLPPGGKIEVESGDKVETLEATVTWRSAAGDDVSFEPGSLLIGHGTQEVTGQDGKEFTIDYLILSHGTATGQLSQATSVGTDAGWMTAPAGTGKTTVFIDSPFRSARTKTQFRAVRGQAWISYHAFRTFLPERHSIVMTVNTRRPGRLAFRTGQQNRDEVQIELSVSSVNRIVVRVPRATSGVIEPEPENKTKVGNDITSLKTGKIRLETRFAGREPRQAQLGPGTSARIDNETGDIQVAFEAVAFEILESAIMLTSEFSTIAQSNFADLK